MGRRQAAAQLTLELPEDYPAEPEQEPMAEEPAPPPRRTRAKSSEERPAGWRRRIGRVFLWTCLAILVLGVVVIGYQIDQFLASDARFVLTASPDGRSSRNLVVDGISYASRDDVMRVFAGDIGRSVYLTPLADRRQQLLAVDWVRDASVQRRWPSRLVVRISERTPVAFVVMSDVTGRFAGSEVALVDADGVLLKPPSKARFSLPALVGISRRDTPEVRRRRVGEAVEMIREVQAYAGQISEIDVSDPENLTITEVVQGRPLRLRLGNKNYLSRLRNFLNRYPDFSKRLPNARTFDLRLDGNITAQDGGPNEQ